MTMDIQSIQSLWISRLKQLVPFLLIIFAATLIPADSVDPPSAGFFRRKDFPDGFVFGSGTSNFQVEGGLREGGRRPSIWDGYAAKNNLYYPYQENAVGHYYQYKEDVRILKDVGFDAYRFAISWSRVMPDGRTPNQGGVNFYKSLLKELLDNGIEPYVTLMHFDYPRTLLDEYGAFLSSQITEDFKNYADFCFKTFGDMVKNWITLNEPFTYVLGAFINFDMAPTYGEVSIAQNGSVLHSTAGGLLSPSGRSFRHHRDLTSSSFSLIRQKRSSDDDDGTVSAGDRASSDQYIRGTDPGRDPYTVGHNLILAHAKAIKVYKDKYQKYQQGRIGISLISYWCVPYNTDLEKDKEAAIRCQDFVLGWFLDPLTTGKYPETMRNLISDGRLPEFTDEESALLRQYPLDFLGINYYTAVYAFDDIYSNGGDWNTDKRVIFLSSKDGIPIGERATPTSWLYVYPEGILDLLLYVKTKYNNPTIYITENGIMESDNSTLSLWDALFDYKRVSFFYQHLWFVKRAIGLGVNVNGFFQWALLDNFEWSSHFNDRYGITYVDYKDGLKYGSRRYPKLSAGWFKFLLEKSNFSLRNKVVIA